MAGETKEVTEALLDFGKTIDPIVLFPTLHPEAGEFVINDPYGLAMAISLDRGTKAEIIWTIPYDLRQQLGHLDPYLVNRFGEEELAEIFSKLPRKPRYINAAPRTVKELTTMVVSDFDGDASKIWDGKTAQEVNRSFQSIYGVGPGIASMSVLLIEKAYGIRFSDMDRRTMEIKADVHTMRVLYRLGMSAERSESAAIAAARRMNPDYPGEIDAPLWVIGRNWCLNYHPQCRKCPMAPVCQKISSS